MMKKNVLHSLFVFTALFFSGSTIGNDIGYSISNEKLSLSMDKNGNSIGCNAYTDYYHSGKIKEVGCQGYFHSNGTTIGTVYEYDEEEKLIRTKYYHPDEFGKDYQAVREYDTTGNVISEKFFNNDALYEVDKIELNGTRLLEKLAKGEVLYRVAPEDNELKETP